MGKVLILPGRFGEFCGEGMQVLKEAGLEIRENPYRRPPGPAELAHLLEGMDAVIISPDNIITGDLIRETRGLKVIATRSVGYEHIDVQTAVEAGVIVTYTPWTNHQATADHAFALMLAVSRRVAEADRIVRAGRWKRVIGTDVWGKTLGLIGMGAVGQAMARRARGFDMRVLYHNRTRREDLEKELGLEYAPLDSLLQGADFVSLHLSLTPETRGIIGKRELALMKPEAILVNTARGGLVDQAALDWALKERRIAGAGLDVFEQEPMEARSPLVELDHVVLTPHISGATYEAIAAMGRVVAEDVVRVLRHELPLHPVKI
ncbi:hypothetical protein SY88_22030 [Clostridiales bacterium PH28_bin88]|nr:hypothetical protein SY88_22030 [Clostridiales bacterium PH28_bin88]